MDVEDVGKGWPILRGPKVNARIKITSKVPMVA